MFGLRVQTDLIVSRPIINADEHLVALSKRSRECVVAATNYITIKKPNQVHLFSHDVDRITLDLKGSGFDLGRGFKICGLKVLPIQHE